MVRVQKFGNFRYRKGQLVWKLRNHYDWGPSTNSISRASVFLFYFQKLLLSLDHNVSYKNGEGISHAGTSLGLQNISCKYSLLKKNVTKKSRKLKKVKKKWRPDFFKLFTVLSISSYMLSLILIHFLENFGPLLVLAVCIPCRACTMIMARGSQLSNTFNFWICIHYFSNGNLTIDTCSRTIIDTYLHSRTLIGRIQKFYRNWNYGFSCIICSYDVVGWGSIHFYI